MNLPILSSNSGYANTTYIVQLTPAENDIYTDKQLIDYCDDYNHHFGGLVIRAKGLKSDLMYAKVKVYID